MLSYIISKDINLIDLASELNFGITLIISDSRFYMYEYKKKPTEFCSIDEKLNKLGYDRIFEDCFLFFNGTQEERFDAIQFLFHNVGSEHYLKSINHKKNVDCYNFLFKQALMLPNTCVEIVLDLGSGPGVIADTEILNAAGNVICFDTAECHLNALEKNGLTPLTLKEFFGLQPLSIDIVISSYVLHYQSLTNIEFNQVLSILKNNGVWVANFHKSKGVGWFLNELRDYDYFDLRLSESAFGTIIMIQKKI